MTIQAKVRASTMRRFYVGAGFAVLLAILGVAQALLDRGAIAQGDLVQAPAFEVDPLWPKPLPNKWLLGMAIGVWVVAGAMGA